MNRYTLAQLLAMPTIEQGHTDDLKAKEDIRHSLGTKVWLSRLTKEDGAPYDNQVTVEAYHYPTGEWLVVDTYQPI